MNLKEEKIVKINRSKILIGAIIFLSFILGWAFGNINFQITRVGFTPKIVNEKNEDVDFGIFWQAWNKVVNEYDGDIDYTKLINGAIRGMVEAVDDPYTVFMDADESAIFSNELDGTISGIGAEIGKKDDNILIIAPLENTPASKAGLKAKDIILKINDESTEGMDVDTAVSKIRGEVGTQVSLTIKRGEEELVFKMTREKIETKSVEWEIKEGNIGYIEISRFDSNTTSQTQEATKALSDKNVKGIILDLRNNPGGYLDSSIDVASEFLKEGVIVTEKTHDSSQREDYKASGRGNLTSTSIPMVVLVNEGSASAAEIVTGALQDQGRAIVVGMKTFGKGSVQTIESIGQGMTIKITIAHWYTPNGKNIGNEGITPDISIDLTEEDIKNEKDPQLEKALETIKNKI